MPAGTYFESPHSSKTKVIVVRSGRAQMGEWVTEEHNVLDDYHRTFGDGESSPVAKGIALMTDSDNTHTRAIGDYDDIRVMSKKEK